jgi:SAM-dependent methyltransferase
LSARAYLRERLEPARGDPWYLHLTDLLTFLRSCAADCSGALLDYGCGGSPYRSLFARCRPYVRADIEDHGGVDILLTPDLRVPGEEGRYAVVLSTQVLEHLPHSEVYLREARRVLAPGGRLILTTHGTFPDHPCPHDCRRWTAEGLRLTVEEAGFEVESVARLTTGMRFAAQMLRAVSAGLYGGRGARRRIAWCLRLAAVLLARLFIPLAERETAQGVAPVRPGVRGEGWYIALGLTARKPGGSERG